MASIWEELKRRKVVRVAVAYAVVGWLLIQMASTTFPLLQLPPWSATLVTALLILGFPLALILSWAYDFTPEGVKRDDEVAATASVAPSFGRKFDFAIIGVLVLALGYFIWERQNTGVPGVVKDGLVKTVAVLPFVNVSDDPEQDFFSDGISEELLNMLAKVQGLRVTSRTSAFSFKGSNKSIRQVAEELGVQFVLEGSVRRAQGTDEKLRVGASLIDVETDSQLWSDTYELENVFAVYDEITGQVVAALEVALLGIGATPLDPVQETMPDVYDDFLLARELLANQSTSNLSRAAELFEAVIQRDPDYAAAYGRLAWTYRLMTWWDTVSNEEALEHMRVLIPKALELDNMDAEAWIMRAAYEWIAGNRAAADAARQTALEFGPDNPIVLFEAIDYLIGTSDAESARDLVDRLLSIDPLGTLSLRQASEFYARVGEWGTARQLLERIRAVNEDSLDYYWGLFTQGHLNGELAELCNLLEEASRLDDEDSETPGVLATIYTDVGDMESAERWSAQAIQLGADRPLTLLSAMYLALVQNETIEATLIAESLVREDGRRGSKALALGVLATRDLAAGRPEDGIARYLRTYPGLGAAQIPIRVPEDTWAHISAAFYATLDLARLYRSAGDAVNSEALLDAVERELPHWPATGHWGIGFAAVELHALRGENDEAIQALRTALDSGWWSLWRWRLLRNPNLESLQGDSEFQALLDQLEARMLNGV